jgi:hypothetical protein
VPANANVVKHIAKTPQAARQQDGGKKQGMPPEQLRMLVNETLAQNSFYAPGFLITRRDVEPIFSKLLEKGLTTPNDQEALADLVVSEQSSLAKLLKTPSGRAFMKKLGSDTAAYDRLERMSWTFQGRKLAERIINDKDGVAILKQIDTAAELATFSKELAADPRTEDFHLPTGKAHTAEEFVERVAEVLQRNAE